MMGTYIEPYMRHCLAEPFKVLQNLLFKCTNTQDMTIKILCVRNSPN